MKKAKVLSLFLTALLCAGILGGCGGPTGSSTNSTSSAAESSATASQAESKASTAGNTGETVTLEFLQQKREATNTFDQIIAAFQEKNPNVIVEQNTVPDAGTVLMARAASDDMPDLLTHWPADAAYVQFVKEGQIKDLTGKVYTENIIAEHLEACEIDGKNYIIPISLNFMGVFYNVDKFEAGGYEVPTTWDEMVTLAEKIKADGEIPFMLPNKDSWTTSQLWSSIDGKDRGSNAETYEKMTAGTSSYSDDALYKSSLEKVLWMVEFSQGDTLSLGYDQAINDFATGKGLMFPQGIWALPSLEAANPDLNVGMFPMPNEAGDMKQPLGVDLGIAAGSNSAKDDAIDTFLAYLTSTEGGQMYSDLDHSPSSIKGVVAGIPQAQAVLDLIDSNGVLDVSSPPAGFEETKRSKLQTVLLDGDIDKFLSELSADWTSAAST